MKLLTTASVIHVMDEENIPAITIVAGETLQVETAKPGIPDAVFTKDYSVEPHPKRILTITGPIYVEGCEPGDLLKVEILDIQLDTRGKMWMGQWMGILKDEVDHCCKRDVLVENGVVHFSETTQFPIQPMIGTLGVVPAGTPVDCLTPGRHGGNMDAREIAIGSTVYLPVQVKGGLLAVGDVHAAMGMGEVFGTGIEIGSTVTMRIDVVKGQSLPWPLVERENSYDFLISGPDLDENCREAVRTTIAFLMQRNGISFDEAYALAGQTCDLKIAQVVNPERTVAMEIPKSILKS